MRPADELRDAVEAYLGSLTFAAELGGLQEALRYSLEAGGKPIHHVRSSNQCGDCHVTSSWKPARFDHMGVSDPCAWFVDLAPTLLMNEVDLPATRLIQPASRVGYAALFAGERSAIEQFGKWLQQNKQPAERLRDIAEASPEVNNAADRAGRFLSLASLVGVLLCAVAIAMTARRYVKRHLDFAALLKTLGATRKTLIAAFSLEYMLIGLATALFALAAGGVAAWFVVARIMTLPSSFSPAVAAGTVAVALVLTVGIGLIGTWRVLGHKAAPVLRNL